MKAIILAAGQTQRLSEGEPDSPRCLLEIGDTNLLHIQIDTLHQCGITDIAIVRGYRKEQINIPGITYYDNDDYENTSVLHSLFTAEKELEGDVVVLYSDIYYEKEVILKLLKSDRDITVMGLIDFEHIRKLKTNTSVEDLEMIDFEVENKIKHIGKNLPPQSEYTRGQFIGIFKLTDQGCRKIKKFHSYFKAAHDGGADDYRRAWVTDMFAEMVELGVHLSASIVESGWFEVNTFEDYTHLLKIQSVKDKYLLVKTDWKERVKKYNQLDWVNNDRLLQEMLDPLVEEAENRKLLDIGTGTGKILIYLKLKGRGMDLHGCDLSPDMLGKIGSEHGFGLRTANVQELDACYGDETFDYITARMVFHHVPDLALGIDQVYKRLNPGGKFVLCEGNPPSYVSHDFYKEMFAYKEDRNVFMESELINLLVRGNFQNITTRTVVLTGMSMNNWLDNSGLPQRNIEIIKRMHYNCSDEVKQDYNMRVTSKDIFMDWKFSIVTGEKQGE